MSNRYKCDKCDANRGRADYPNGSWCFSCGDFVKNKTMAGLDSELRIKNSDPAGRVFLTLNNKHIKYLQKYFIDMQDLDDYEVAKSTDDRIIFRLGLESYWHRAIDNQEPKWLYFGDKQNKQRWLSKHKSRNLCIVEDPISAIRVHKYLDVYMLGGTNLDDKKISPVLYQYKNIILWLDGDAAGRKAAFALRKKLKLIRPVQIVWTNQDPKCFTPDEMKDILTKVIRLKILQRSK